jgi:uncharacterized protein YggE
MTATPTPAPTESTPQWREPLPVRPPLRPFVITALAVVVAIVLVGVLVIAGVALGRATKSAVATVTVTGSGTVQGVPNEVQFTCGVQTTAATAPEALKENDERTAALERVLLRQGVVKKNFQTSGLNIWENTNQYGVVTGFTVQDTLDVTMFNLKKAGLAIEAAAKEAGNGIVFNGITLSISDDSKFLAAARERAMHAAYEAAKGDANGGGDGVGGIIRITDQVVQSNVEPIGLPAVYASATEHGVPIEAGQQPVTVQVTVVYALS